MAWQGLKAGLAEKVRNSYNGFSENPGMYLKNNVNSIVRDYWDFALACGGTILASRFIEDTLFLKYVSETYVPIKDATCFGLSFVGVAAGGIIALKKGRTGNSLRPLRNTLGALSMLNLLDFSNYVNQFIGVVEAGAALVLDITGKVIRSEYYCSTTGKTGGIEDRVG